MQLWTESLKDREGVKSSPPKILKSTDGSGGRWHPASTLPPVIFIKKMDRCRRLSPVNTKAAACKYSLERQMCINPQVKIVPNKCTVCTHLRRCCRLYWAFIFLSKRTYSCPTSVVLWSGTQMCFLLGICWCWEKCQMNIILRVDFIYVLSFRFLPRVYIRLLEIIVHRWEWSLECRYKHTSLWIFKSLCGDFKPPWHNLASHIQIYKRWSMSRAELTPVQTACNAGQHLSLNQSRHSFYYPLCIKHQYNPNE